MDNLEGPSDISFGSEIEISSPTPPVVYYYVLPSNESGYDSKDTSLNDSLYISTLNEEHSTTPLHAIQNGPLNDVSTPAIKEESLVSALTYVFFDLETTGLPQFNGALNTQITEMSFIAVAKEDFERSANHELKDVRVMNKLSLCIKPRCSVHYQAGKITGLDDRKLSMQHNFDESTAQMVVNYIMHLPQPVCLLAHNGNVFDFPLLKAELRRVGVTLPPSVLTADTLVAIRTFEIFGPPEPTTKGAKKPKQQRNSRSNSLENLFRYFFKKKFLNKHSSEGDCIALMMVCHKLKEKLIPWINDNQSYFKNIDPMW